ncbi:protein LZIC [Galendromus occidentalis]|uniref:Protein LZIC n=1 Tax=Galendromus occidentalis TaxID=34638 RepID=A0AAJ6QXB0_9ACAR|nr:protein LZIC [Galendromus occidentalis]
MSRGKAETTQLQKKLEEQLERLVDQLADLEQEKSELSEEEYNDMKQDTVEQLKEFQASLDRILKGDITLVDTLNGLQLAIQAAISDAFRTPEIIRLFAKKQPVQLRQRLTELERDLKISKIALEPYNREKVEILLALRKLGDTLSPGENSFIENHSSASMKQFEKIDENVEISDRKLFQLAATSTDSS